MSVDTKMARDLAAALNREGLDYDEEEAMLVRFADEVDRLRLVEYARDQYKLVLEQCQQREETKWKPLLAAAERHAAIHAKDGSDCDELADVLDAIAACEVTDGR